MGLLVITQRVDDIAGRNERRDALDQSWCRVANDLGHDYVQLPNNQALRVPDILDQIAPSGFILSGGNSIGDYEPDNSDHSKSRDATETAVLDWAISEGKPIVGVCRGMQMINTYFGGSLSRVEEHVAVRHAIIAEPDYGNLPAEVNSYHEWSIAAGDIAADLVVMARDFDGNVEAFHHQTLPVLGLMWHPEREHPANTTDTELMRQYLK